MFHGINVNHGIISNMKMRVAFSLVLFRHALEDILPLLKSLSSLAAHRPDYGLSLVIYDASPAVFGSPFFMDIEDSTPGVTLSYRKSSNIGFGSANNLNFKTAMLSFADLFVVVNPDISFASQELSPLLDWIQDNASHVSCVAPLVVNASGQIQYSAKQNPTFLSLLLGRIGILRRIRFFARYDSWHRGLGNDYAKCCFDSSYLSGCFLIVPSCYYLAVGGFCERFFLHLEDADLVRRLSAVGRTLHNPIGRVTHLWARGSHRSLVQMRMLARSYIIYTSIWGFAFA